MKRSYEELMKEIKEKWTVENIAAVLDEMGVEYELVEKVEDEKYLFYSEDFDTYFNSINIDEYDDGTSAFSLIGLSASKLKESGTNDKQVIKLFEQRTNFEKVRVSEL